MVVPPRGGIAPVHRSFTTLGPWPAVAANFSEYSPGDFGQRRHWPPNEKVLSLVRARDLYSLPRVARLLFARLLLPNGAKRAICARDAPLDEAWGQPQNVALYAPEAIRSKTVIPTITR
jgi:hypothetical protein